MLTIDIISGPDFSNMGGKSDSIKMRNGALFAVEFAMAVIWEGVYETAISPDDRPSVSLSSKIFMLKLSPENISAEEVSR